MMISHCRRQPEAYIKDHVQPTFTNFQSAFSCHSFSETLSLLTLNMPTRIVRMFDTVCIAGNIQ